jgi:DNA-binding NarL/FixJ family response regulator
LKGGTLLVSRYTSLLPFYKTYFEALGYTDVHVTDKEKDGLNMLINEIKPRYVFIDSCFYSFATPYMMGRLLATFPKLIVAAITLNSFSDDLAAWFVFHGVKYYIKLTDGIPEFRHGLHCILEGKSYIAPAVQAIIDGLPEWPDVKQKVERRQIEVLVMLCNGNSPDDIAASLHISRRTVDWHIDELKNVFHAHTREQLICIAFYLDIVNKDDLSFFSRKEAKVNFPEWAEYKRGMRGGRVNKHIVDKGII